MTEFTILGHRVEGAIDADGLETFPCPDYVEEVKFSTQELTAICPVTNQPDLYSLEISYVPKHDVVESKSLKLYLMRYRDIGIFGEDLAHDIAKDLFERLQAARVHVSLVQQVRGGLVMTVEAHVA